MNASSVDYGTELVYTPVGDRVTPQEALDRFAGDGAVGAVGFVYTPNEATWFRITSDGASVRDGSTVPEDVFELRAFTSDRELRWWRTANFDEGSAVVLTEEKSTAATGRHPLAPSNTRALLLWGSATGEYDAGWAQYVDRRVGHVWLPVKDAPSVHSRVRLSVVDYVARDLHGNVGVVDQRFIQVEAR